MDTNVTVQTDTFATRAEAVENATIYYGEDCEKHGVKLSGSNRKGWTWQYDPPHGAADVTNEATATDTAVVTPYAGSVANPGSMEFAGWMSLDTSSDSTATVDTLATFQRDLATATDAEMLAKYASTSTLPLAVLVPDAATDAAPNDEATAGQPATDSEPTEGAASERMVIVQVGYLMPQRMAETTLKAIERKLTTVCIMRDATTFEVVEREAVAAKTRKASVASGPVAPTCRVDGLDWSIDLCPDEGNRKACESMKRRVDEAARKLDLAGLHALSWAGCPAHEKTGNTYQKQGAQYRANWIAYVEQRIADNNAVLSAMTGSK